MLLELNMEILTSFSLISLLECRWSIVKSDADDISLEVCKALFSILFTQIYSIFLSLPTSSLSVCPFLCLVTTIFTGTLYFLMRHNQFHYRNDGLVMTKNQWFASRFDKQIGKLNPTFQRSFGEAPVIVFWHQSTMVHNIDFSVNSILFGD